MSLTFINDPVIHGLYEPVKGFMRTNSQEYHKTDPKYFGPSDFARCSHCVNHRSACFPMRLPDMESSSAFAMLSIQMVFAPSNFPILRAKYPGAAPVERTTSGRIRINMKAMPRSCLINRHFCQ